jgi:hypothetical protein
VVVLGTVVGVLFERPPAVCRAARWKFSLVNVASSSSFQHSRRIMHHSSPFKLSPEEDCY